MFLHVSKYRPNVIFLLMRCLQKIIENATVIFSIIIAISVDFEVVLNL